MRKKTLARLIAIAATALTASGALVAIPSAATAADSPPLACGESMIEKELKNGSAWRMCARIHPIKGLILEQIEFKPATGAYEYEGYKRVLDQLNIAQLNVPYDTGHVQYNDITSYGFGKQYLMEQGPELCLGEAIDVDQSFTYNRVLIERTMPGICATEEATGLQTHAQETQIGGGTLYIDQGTGLTVASMSKISWYEYQQRVVFDDHGQIDVGLGATGDIAPGAAKSNFFGTNPKVGWPLSGPSTTAITPVPTSGPLTESVQTYAASHWHNAIYRVDFGIDSGEKQTVEQWDFASPGAGTRAPIVEGTGTVKTAAFSSIANEDHDQLSWWRVLNPNSKNKDGHSRSYEIVNNNTANVLIPVTQPSVSFTNYRACEEYASANLNAGCANKSILDYVAEDTHELTDPVAWVNVGFHHTDKDEDQSPMPIHWQKFQIVPRDFFAQKPTIKEARQCINGPFSSVNAVTRPCLPENTAVPTVSVEGATGSTPVITEGTKLVATPGTWRSAAFSLNYSYVWFRNGEPIINSVGGQDVPAVGSSYTLVAADKDKRITVKVTASQTGYPSGVAESAVTGFGDIPAPETTPTPTPGEPTVDTPAPVSPAPAARTSSTVSAKLSSSKVKAGKHARITITARSGGALATGRVQVMHGTKVLRSATLRNGTVRLTLPKLKGTKKYTLRVRYVGSESAAPVSSKAVTLRVVK
ncbi:MAG: Ig-like domain repeat protein [Aeromicrobium sp.]